MSAGKSTAVLTRKFTPVVDSARMRPIRFASFLILIHLAGLYGCRCRIFKNRLLGLLTTEPYAGAYLLPSMPGHLY